MQRDEGRMNVANTRARGMFIHFCSNKITENGPGTLAEQVTKSSANKGAGKAMRVPYLIELVNERAEAKQIYHINSARSTKLSSAMPLLVIPPENDLTDEDG